MRKGGGGLGKCDPTFFYQMHNLINSSLLVDFLLIIDNNIRLLDLQLKHKNYFPIFFFSFYPHRFFISAKKKSCNKQKNFTLFKKSVKLYSLMLIE